VFATPESEAPGVVVRRLTAADHASLRLLRLRALQGAPDAYGSTYERELAFADDVWRDRLRPAGNPHFGAIDPQGELVGLAVGEADRDDHSAAFVLGVWVDEAARGRGVIDLLLDAVEQWAHATGCTLLRLHVTDGNAPAERCYTRLGFRFNGADEARPRDGKVERGMERPIARG
jgi:GNAT superfamily N-acetyltransferase